MLDKIKALAEAGASLIWLHAGEKRPIEADWTEKPTPSWRKFSKAYREGNNVGIRLGEPSRMDDGFYLHCIDVDIRDPKFAEVALAKLRELFPGVVFNFFPTVKSGSGGESRHYYFVAAKAYFSKKLVHSDEKIQDKAGHWHWCWEIELFGTGKQTVLPPSIHPDTGLPYEWLFEVDWLIGFPIIDADLLDSFFEEDDEDYIGRDTGRLENVSLPQVEDQLEDLNYHQWCEDRDGWMRLGMALKHQFAGTEDEEAAFQLWCKYSQQSDKFDEKQQRKDWRSFKGKTNKPVTLRSILWAAKHGRIIKSFDEADYDEEHEIIDESPSSFDAIPKHLLSIPGDLQHVVDFFNETAPKHQPQFAVQAGLAVGSVVAGRNFQTDYENFTSLYFVNVGVTGSGKEHCLTVVDKILKETKLFDALKGPKAYASEAGVRSELLARPRHICVADELGRYLKTSRDSGDANKLDAQTALIELWGRLHGTYDNIGYSTHGKTREQIEAMRAARVTRPALTMLAMTTPKTLYDAIGMADVQSGFLNRLLVVETPVGRQMSRKLPPTAKIADGLRKWMKHYAWRATSEDDAFAMATDPTFVPDPITIPFAEACQPVLTQIEADMIAEQNKADELGLGDLYSRTREMIMRVALIVALSDWSDVVELCHLEWARDYVMYYHGKMVEMFHKNLGKTEFEDIAEKIYALVAKKGDKGMTEYEISHANRAFRRLVGRDREEVLRRLRIDHRVSLVEMNTGGRKRTAYVVKRKKG